MKTLTGYLQWRLEYLHCACLSREQKAKIKKEKFPPREHLREFNNIKTS